MLNASLRNATALVALTALLPLAALAAPKPFTGPTSGWDHTVGATATPQAPRAQETWKKSDGEYITYLSDAGLTYDDTLALVKKNITDNGFKPTVDTDRKCDGRRAHEVEMTFGTSVVRQIIVDDAPGVTKVTYMRPTAVAPSADVSTAITAYCGPAS
jgi:hypothetical protein